MRALLWTLQVACACSLAVSADLDQDLLSSDWILSQVGGDTQASIQLPGSSLQALEAAGVVQDSLYRS